MANFNMMIGVAGSGKSEYVKNNKQNDDVVLSSDNVREVLFGDVNDQKHNSEVFTYMQNSAVQLLKDKKNVWYDATNLSIKDRKSVLNRIKNIEDVFVTAYIIATPEEIIYKQNEERNRVVPKDVISRMIKKFQFPVTNEGFNDIKVVYHPCWISYSKTFSAAFEEMIGYNQNNPHHTLTLDEHCKRCYDLTKDAESNVISVASYLHDYGKLFTSEYDEHLFTTHYINHENVGAYKSLFFTYPGCDFSLEDRCRITSLINYHMIPYKIKDANKETVSKYRDLFDDIWDDICFIHVADELAH